MYSIKVNPDVPLEEDQDKILEDSRNVIKSQSFQMKRSLDQAKIMDAVKYSNTLISELRTGLMSPKNYYDLYMTVCDQLRYLESFLFDEYSKGKSLGDLYEIVQHAGNILPRLYLLSTVGSVYIKSKQAPAKEILRDLVEMCRGVQHPMRGLFVRNYLSQISKDKLPDTLEETEDGSVKDSIDFVIQNFTEMNKLWVRLQHQGPVRDREKRERERLELRILVGTNLVRLSQLESINTELYSNDVLPRLMEQIINCKDQIAQQYLMECVIQVFPDEFHLATLETLLESCVQLQPGVNIKDILGSLIDRLVSFSIRSPEEIPKDIAIFDIFYNHIREIVSNRPKMSLNDILSLQVSLLNLSLKLFPERLNYIDNIFGYCIEKFAAAETQKLENEACIKRVIELLTAPVDSYGSIVAVLDLENYTKLMDYLEFTYKKKVSVNVVESLLRHSNSYISDVDKVNKLLAFIRPLIEDDPENSEQDKEEFEEEQILVARLIHFIVSPDHDVQFQLFAAARRHFGLGGAQRIKYTLVPLIFRSFALGQAIRQKEEKGVRGTIPSKKIFQFLHEMITALAANYAELALRLFMQASHVADVCGFEAIAYEFVTQAFVLYEDNISDSKSQTAAISLIIGTLQQSQNYGVENYDTLITKCALYSAKLLKKPDQCRSICLCSHLFWKGTSEEAGFRQGKRVFECIQRSCKTADSYVDPVGQVELFVEVLDTALYYFEAGNEYVSADFISQLISMVNGKVANLEGAREDTATVLQFLRNVKEVIARRQREEGKAHVYRDVVIS